jgi:hypothetical protein
MHALGQKLACARRASTQEERGRRSNGDATVVADITAREPKVATTSLLSWLNVEDHAQPGAAIWIVALAAMICIGLAYAYFSHITG